MPKAILTPKNVLKKLRANISDITDNVTCDMEQRCMNLFMHIEKVKLKKEWIVQNKRSVHIIARQ